MRKVVCRYTAFHAVDRRPFFFCEFRVRYVFVERSFSNPSLRKNLSRLSGICEAVYPKSLRCHAPWSVRHRIPSAGPFLCDASAAKPVGN